MDSIDAVAWELLRSVPVAANLQPLVAKAIRTLVAGATTLERERCVSLVKKHLQNVSYSQVQDCLAEINSK